MSKLILFETPKNDGQKVFIAGTTSDIKDRFNNNNPDDNFLSASNVALDFDFSGDISMVYVQGENIDGFSLSIDGAAVPLLDRKKIQYGDTDFLLVEFAKTTGNKATLSLTREDNSKGIVLVRVYLLNPFIEFEDPKFSQIDMAYQDSRSIIHESIYGEERLVQSVAKEKNSVQLTAHKMTAEEVFNLKQFRRKNPNFCISEGFEFKPDNVYRCYWVGGFRERYFAYKQAGVDLSFQVQER